MMLTGDVGELGMRGVASSGRRAAAAEPRDLAVVGREQALATAMSWRSRESPAERRGQMSDGPGDIAETALDYVATPSRRPSRRPSRP